jgi:hypothetical protein
VVVAAGQGAGLTSRAAGATGGAESVVLIDTNHALHHHGISLTGTSSVQNADHSHTTTATITGNTGNDTPDHGHTSAGNNIFTYVSPSGAYTLGAGTLAGTTTVSTGGASARHAHPISVPFSAGSSTESSNHAHTVPLSGNTADQGAAYPHENMPPWIAIGQIIRLLPPWRPTP